MTILCVTHPATKTTNVVEVAAQLARATRQRLVISAVLPALQLSHDDSAETVARAELQRDLARVHELGNIDVQSTITFGPLEDAVARDALAVDAQLIVIGDPHTPASPLYALLLEQLANRLQVPLMLVRSATPFAAWNAPGHALRVLVAVEDTANSDAALSWVSRLADYGPLEVVAAHLRSPRGTAELEHALPHSSRMGVRLIALEVLNAEVINQLARDERIDLIIKGLPSGAIVDGGHTAIVFARA